MGYVLIVDDDEDFALAAAAVLRSADHEVDIELDVDQAVARMERRRPDLAILDVMFPESSSAGFDLARTMRLRNERLRDIPILYLTAINLRFPLAFGADDLDDARLPGEGFLEKPLDLDELKSTVADLLEENDGGDSPD